MLRTTILKFRLLNLESWEGHNTWHASDIYIQTSFWQKYLREKDHINQDIDRRVILQVVLERGDVRMSSSSDRTWIRPADRPLWTQRRSYRIHNSRKSPDKFGYLRIFSRRTKQGTSAMHWTCRWNSSIPALMELYFAWHMSKQGTRSPEL
jgi:hypothetical protein